jgi:hypothetical protein
MLIMKKIRHWLHILLVLITGGVWLPVYLIIVSTTEMYNRGYRAGVARCGWTVEKLERI